MKKEQFLSTTTWRKIFFLLVIGLCLTLFRHDLLQWYNSNVIDRLFQNVVPHWTIDLLIGFTCLLAITLSFYGVYKQKIIDTGAVIFLSILFAIFLYFRYTHGYYDFIPFSFSNRIFYVDSLSIIYLFIVYAKAGNYFCPLSAPRYNDSPFIVDTPILNSSQDLFQRKEFAKVLAYKIQSKIDGSNVRSLAIGINGPWGSGKTSFANMVKQHIEEENRIILEFFPWRSSTPQKIIEDYFGLLISAVQEYDPSLSNNLSKYVRSLAKIDDNIITKSLDTISDYIFDGDDKNEMYNSVNEAIKATKKQIIVFIDDLDRLDTREITEVLRLVRNTADFSNIVYLVSYDKGYVNEALKRFNPYNYQIFLEKIFQYEFMLPSYDSSVIRDQLKKLLNSNLPPSTGPLIDVAVDYVGPSGKSITSRAIQTHRDAVRLSNAFLFEIDKIRGEVNFTDFYFVQLLKLKFPEVYKIISEHREIIFYREPDKIRLRKKTEISLNELSMEMQIFRAEAKRNANSGSKNGTDEVTVFQLFLETTDLDSFSKDFITEVVHELLEEKNTEKVKIPFADKKGDYKSFVYARNFHKYFNIQLLESDLSASDFEAHRMGDYDKYEEKLLEWIEQGKLSSVQDNLEKIKSFSNQKEWENHIKILIKIGKIQYEKGGRWGINYLAIAESLNYPKQRKGQILFFTNEEEYREYIKTFFKEVSPPYVFESTLLSVILTRFFAIALSREEIEGFLLDYFKKYATTHNELTSEFRELHSNCIQENAINQTIPEAQDIFVNYFRKYLKAQDLTTFIKHDRPEAEFFTIDEKWIKVFFSNWEAFESYLNTAENLQNSPPHLDEFKRFFVLFTANSYKPVEFKFEFLEPQRWS
jgi:GTPase SAR1 family protein